MGLLNKLFGGKADLTVKAEFANYFIQRARERGFEDIQFNEDEFTLAIDDAGKIYLQNIYDTSHHVEDPEHKEAELNHFIDTLLSGGVDDLSYDQAKDKLVPLIRERVFLEFNRIRGETEGEPFPEVPHLPISDNLIACIGHDGDDSISFINEDTLRGWNVSFTDAFSVAYRNLFELSQEPFIVIQKGVYLAPWEDNYAACRMVYTELINELEVRGKPVVAVPNRDTLIVTGSEDMEGLECLFKLMAEAWECPRPMSPQPMILRNNEWVDFFPEYDTPLYDKFQYYKVQSLANDYDEQKQVLEKYHEAMDMEIFVATYTALKEDETGEIYSHCVWTKDVDSILPKTDRVFFYNDDMPEDKKTLGYFKWDKVAEVMGDIMEKTDYYPVRYRVKEFPSGEQIGRMG